MSLNTNTNRESMVLYESAYKAINYISDNELQLEALKGLIEYGFYGIIPESENPTVNMVYVQAIPSMRSAKERYDVAVNNGKKGGRPTEISTEEIMAMKQEGMTNNAIAQKIGCSEKNIEKRVSTYKKSHPTNPTNLSVSDTESISESSSLSENGVGTNAKREDKKREEDLTEKEIEAILRDYENHVDYKNIQEKYNLDFQVKYFVDYRAKDLLLAKKEERKQKDLAENGKYYTKLYTYWNCDYCSINSLLAHFPDYSAKQIADFIDNHPEYTMDKWKEKKNQGIIHFEYYPQYLNNGLANNEI